MCWCQTLGKKKRELDICLDYKQYYIYRLFMSLLNNLEFSIHVKEQHQF